MHAAEGLFQRLRSPRLGFAIRLVSLGVIAASLLLLARQLPFDDFARQLAGWTAEKGMWGKIGFILVYVITTVLLLPAWILTVVAGATFGLLTGTILVVLGANLAVAVCFLISRHLAREAVARRLQDHPRFAAIDRAVSAGGWRVVALLRLSPVIPFTLQNYLYGVTAIRFWHCVLTSAVAMLPGTFLYVYLGYAGRVGLSAAGSGGGRTPGEWSMIGVGLAATAAVTVYITRLARRELKRQGEISESLVDASSAGKPAKLLPTMILAGLALAIIVLAGVITAGAGA